MAVMAGVSLISCTSPEPASVEGRYNLADDIDAYAGEYIILAKKDFKYGRFTDVVPDPYEKEYPLKGSYTVDGCLVSLDIPGRFSFNRILTWKNGRYLMWKPKEYHTYLKTKRVPNGVLYQAQL